MKKAKTHALVAIAVVAAVVLVAYSGLKGKTEVVDVSGENKVVKLPKPSLKGQASVEEALQSRRSVRSYKNEPLSLRELGQMLWAAQGVTVKWGGRTSPSAGATYPLEAYAVVGNVEGVEPGVYQYIPESHSIRQTISGDVRDDLMGEAMDQSMVGDAPATLVLTAVFERTTGRYGDRGVMYVHMEAGHAGQNIYLQAESLGLGTVAVGAFSDEGVARVLKLDVGEVPLYIFPVGKR